MPTIKTMTATFTDQIKSLAELQKVDTEVYRQKKLLAEHPELQKKLDTSFEKKKAAFKKAEEELRACQMKQKSREGDLQSREEKIKKLQSQLYQLKTNKEYSAMDQEIKGLKADNSLLEEEILKLLDSVDEAKAAVQKEKELLSAEEKKYREESDALKKTAAEIETEVAALQDKRKGHLGNIDPKLLSQYERILAKREGVALVPVLNDACGGCHLELPPQVVNEIRMQDKLINCESCARILYWPG